MFMQNNLFPPDTQWKLPTEMPDFDGPVAIDTENKDPHLSELGPSWLRPGTGYVAGFGVACGNFKGYYPIRHQGGGNMPIENVLNWIAHLMKKPIPKVFANAQYDLGWIEEEGIKEINGTIHDVQIMAPLLDENRYSYGLDSLGKDYLNEQKNEDLLYMAASDFGLSRGKKKAKMSDIKANMWRYPAAYVGEYGEHDAWMTLKLFEKFHDMIKRQDLEYVYQLELDMIPILMRMRRRGIRIDVDRAEKTKKQFMEIEHSCIKKLRDITGFRIDPYSANSVAQAFDKFGIEYARTATGEPSITADFLENMESELGQLVRDARTYQKGYSTFIDSYILNRLYNGRVYGQFNQLKSDEGGTVSGRFSSSNPNLQNIPTKHPVIGPAIRSLFLPEEGEQWMAADYSNQEPRLVVHFAALMGLQGADRVVQRYRDKPSTSYHKIVQEFVGPFIPKNLDPYKTTKTINLGLAYGMGEPKLCKSLGLSTEWVLSKRQNKMVEIAGPEGKAILEAYFREVPFMKKLQEVAQNRATHRKFICTLSGRRCRFPDSSYTRKALNRLIQGSAADQTKEAMRKVDKAGVTMLLTMHDELGLSVRSNDEAREARQIMENAVELLVPSFLDTDLGPSWGEASAIKLD